MRVLIIGLGSIGKRHFENFKSIGCEVSAFSRRPSVGEKTYPSLEEAIESFKPSGVVIANETSEHGKTLEIVLKYPSIKKILVEKPLYSNLPATPPPDADERVKIAYNLRFHPMILELRDVLYSQKILSWTSYVGQNLSQWRPDRDYRDNYSAKKKMGGGVLRDLSHELDLLFFFTKQLNLVGSFGGKFSSLETDAEDFFSLLLSGPSCAHVNIHMNCVDNIGQRFMTVITEENTFHLDLVRGIWRDSVEEKKLNVDKNVSYIGMTEAFLEDDPRLCSFEEGWLVNSLIEEVEKN